MSSLKLTLGAAVLAGSLTIGCGDDGGAGTGGASSGTGAGAGSTGALPSSGAGDLDPGDPHTPATGCDDGYVACGGVCAHVEDDGRHCGGCDVSCSQATTCEGGTTCGCVDGVCVPDAGCGFGPSCDGACIDPSPYANADHCGSCGNRCGDLQLCVGNACLDQDGDGTSCESPLLWTGDETAGFRMAPGTTVPHTFRCGPLDPVPTRWFRVTVEEDRLRLEVDGDDSDDFILEVFGDPACDDAAQVACLDGEAGKGVDLEIEGVTPGTTYWVAVGIIGASSGKPARLKNDS